MPSKTGRQGDRVAPVLHQGAEAMLRRATGGQGAGTLGPMADVTPNHVRSVRYGTPERRHPPDGVPAARPSVEGVSLTDGGRNTPEAPL
jgi:hypothetical protein